MTLSQPLSRRPRLRAVLPAIAGAGIIGAAASLTGGGPAGTSAAVTLPEATVAVNAATTHPASPLLLGQNLAWDNAGDAWNFATNSPNAAVTALLRPLHIGLLRFPGGVMANSYQWWAGVGPISQRPAQSTGGGQQVDAFGTDEFMTEAQALGAQALITVNISNCPAPPGDCPGAQSAANWVQYLNGASTTQMGALRTQYGHPTPYHVHYFELGNELEAAYTPQQYAAVAQAFSAAMKAVDPTIAIGVNSDDRDPTGTSVWDTTMAALPAGVIDFIAPHLYGPGVDGHTATFYNNPTPTVRTYTVSTSESGVHQLRFEAFREDGTWNPTLNVSVDGVPLPETAITQGYNGAGYYTGNAGQWVTLSTPSLLPGPHVLTLSCRTCGWGTRLDVITGRMTTPSGAISTIDLSPYSAATFETIVAGVAQGNWNRLVGLFQTIQASGHALQIIPTEWGTFYSVVNDYATSENEDLSSALYEATTVQYMLRLGIPAAQFFQLSDWMYHVYHAETNTLSVPGLMFQMLAQHLDASVAQTTVTSPTFAVPASDGSPARAAIAEVQSLATTGSGRMDVQLVNLASHAVTVQVNVTGTTPTGSGTLTTITGATGETTDPTSAPTTVLPSSRLVPVAASTLVTLPARSTSVLTFSVMAATTVTGATPKPSATASTSPAPRLRRPRTHTAR